MKRFVVPLFALFALALPLTADAGRWVQKEIYWSKGGGIPGSGVVSVHDTAFAPLPFKTSGGIDTTGKFTLNGADIWRTAHAGLTTAIDTVNVAFLLIQQDSTGAIGPTLSAITYEIDGRAGGYRFAPTDSLSRAWTQVDSAAATFVPNGNAGIYNSVIAIPIRALNLIGGWQPGGNGPENFLQTPYRLMAYNDLRVRFTSQTGIMSGNLRAFIRYWDNDPDGD